MQDRAYAVRCVEFASDTPEAHKHVQLRFAFSRVPYRNVFAVVSVCESRHGW